MAKHNGINPEAAKAYWLALPPDRRTFEAVADRFKVSAQRIGQIAKRDLWGEALEALEDELVVTTEREVRRAIARIARSRADRVAATLELYDRASDLALGLIPLDDAGKVDLAALTKLGDRPLDRLLERMPGLFRMAELAAGEATDRIHVSEIQPVLLAFARIALLDRGEERTRILGMLAAASSGLVDIEGEAVRVS